MKNLALILSILILCFACKKEVKTTAEYEEDQEVKDDSKIVSTKNTMPSTTESIAFANGFKEWNKVSEINFTFNFDRDTLHMERSWNWKPKTSEVTRITAEDTITYNRKNLNKENTPIDQQFINDKYWLLAPYNLIWDKESFTSKVSVNVKAPISDKNMQKLTIVYKKGGYTPGDAYDFYYEGDFIIKEWAFRKGNAKEPSLITTWEDYKTYQGIKIAQTHKTKEEGAKLYFTKLKVTTE